MSGKKIKSTPLARREHTFLRFTLGQRWEHAILLLSGLVLLLTGLPQKYREFSISQDLLSPRNRFS